MKNQVFFKAKLNTPVFNSSFIIRKNLESKLDSCTTSKVVYVSSPAGFGKTTLISQWLKNRSEKKIWLSLDENDNSEKVFISYLIKAFEGFLKEKIGGLLPYLEDSEYILNYFIDNINKITEEVFFILDDFHFISNDKIDKVLFFLINNSPQNLHFIILSRSEAPISFSKFITNLTCNKITSKDLVFSKQELEELFLKNAITITNKEIDIIYHRTDGWALALQSILLCLKETAITELINETQFMENKYLNDFLVNELLSKLEKDEFDFLIKTSILNTFDANLCNSLLEINNAQEIIEKFEKENLFIINLDNNRIFYKYHPLFAEINLKLLKKKDPSLAKNLYIKLSNILKDKGLYLESINYAFLAEDYEFIVSILEIQAHLFFRDYEQIYLSTLIEKIPLYMVLSRVKLSLYQSLILITKLNLDLAEHIFKSAENLYKKNNILDLELDTLINLIYSLLYVKKNETVGKITKHSNLVLANIYNLNENLIGFAYYWLARSFFYIANFKKSIYLIDKFVVNNKNTFMSILNKSFKASILIAIGDLSLAKSILDEIIEDLSKNNLLNHKIALTTYFYLYLIYYKWNKIDLFNKYVKLGLDLIDKNNTLSVVNILSFYYHLISYNIQIGNIEESNIYLYKIKKIWPIGKALDLENRLRILEIKKHIVLGKSNEIPYEWINELITSINSNFLISIKAYNTILKIRRECIVLAEYYISQSLFSRAFDFLELLTELKSDISNPLIEIYILKSIIYKNQNNKQKAMNMMKLALIEAEKNKIISPFIEEKKESITIIRDVLIELKNNKINHKESFAYLVLNSLNTTIVQNTSTKKTITPLSDKELEIVKLVEKKLSNKEIADKLNITINTTKSYLRRVFIKLNVTNRKNMILKVKELKLI